MDSIGITLRDLSYEDTLTCAKLADQAALHSVWIPESVGKQDAMMLLAMLATSTKNCKLAPGVLNAYSRHPVQMLMAACTLDEISQGRFILGLGSGNQGQLQKIGMTHLDRPLLRVREFIEVFRLGLNQSQSTYNGKIFTIPTLSQRNKRENVNIPIYLAAHNPQMLKLAGSIADGVLLNMISTSEIPHSLAFIREGEQKAKRHKKVHIASYVLTCISDNQEEAVLAAKTVLASFCSSAIFRQRLYNLNAEFAETANAVYQAHQKAGANAAIALIDNDIVHQYSIAGNFDHLMHRLQELRGIGLDLPILSIFPVPLNLKQFFPPLAKSGLRKAIIEILTQMV